MSALRIGIDMFYENTLILRPSYGKEQLVIT